MTVDANHNKASDVTTRPSWLRRRVLDGNRLHKWLILILAAGGLGLYGWHMWSMHELREALVKERAAMTIQVEGMVDAQTRSSLNVTALALGWAASQAMQREDFAGVDAHITRMVKVGPVKVIAVMGEDGIVRVSTNKKLEGLAGSTEFPGAPLTATEPTVVEQGAQLLVVAPLEHALGTAVLVYDRPSLARALPGTPPAPSATPTTPPAAPADQPAPAP